MKKRPASILVLSVICWLMGPVYLSYHLWFHTHDPMSSLLNFNLAHLVIALVAFPVGIGIYKVRKWGYFSFLAFSMALVGYFLFEYFTSPLLHNYLLLVTSVVLVGSTSLLLQKHITAPYFNPQLRWWEPDPRYRVNLQAEFKIDGDIRRGHLLDLSLTGCYATIDTKLAVGDTIYVHINLLDHKFKCMSQVKWINEETGGIGLMFTDMSRESKKELRSIVNYLILSMSETGVVVNAGVPKSKTPIDVAL